MNEPLLPALAGRFGDGPAAVQVAGDAISWAELSVRATVLGINISCASVGWMSSALLGGVLVDHFGHRLGTALEAACRCETVEGLKSLFLHGNGHPSHSVAAVIACHVRGS